MPEDLVVVLDCGATNARAVAVGTDGALVGAATRPNLPVAQPGGPEGSLIWPLAEVFGALTEACREVVRRSTPTV